MLQEVLGKQSDPCDCCYRSVVSAAGIAHTERRTLTVQPLIWADLVILGSSNKGDDTSRLTEKHHNRQNKEGPEH